ncbi:hypothetical protein JCM8097_001213 [Rhodosporidiobolus ruineniae]
MQPKMLSLAPADLFPPVGPASPAPLAMPASSVALVGALPAASLLHLALNHLRNDDEEGSSVDQLSEKARGKRRAVDDEDDFLEEEEAAPSLPTGKKGQERRVLVLTPAQDLLRDELVKEGDVSLFGSRRSGETARLLDLVDIRYLPTSAHLTYFLTTVYTSSSSSAQSASSAYRGTNPKSRIDPSYLPYEPTLVVLHAPSDSLEEEANQGGVESYASILALFLSTFSNLSSSPPLLVLHDRLASSLSLPLLPSHLSTKRKRPASADEREEEDDRHRLSLKRVAERFFDWVGEAHEVSVDEPYNGPRRSHHVLTLHASPHIRHAVPAEKVELEYVVSEVDPSDPDEQEEGGVRIELAS